FYCFCLLNRWIDPLCISNERPLSNVVPRTGRFVPETAGAYTNGKTIGKGRRAKSNCSRDSRYSGTYRDGFTCSDGGCTEIYESIPREESTDHADRRRISTIHLSRDSVF